MQKITFTLSFLIMTLATISPAHAYIGPGAGAGAIAVVFGVIASVFLALVGILWYPFKRFMKKRKAEKSADSDTPE